MTDRSLLDKEYFQLQTVVEEFDKKSLTIKAWSVTLTGTISGASAFADNHEILLFAAIVSLMFWFIDGSWKTFQFAYYKRIKEIEAYMSGETKNIINLQIANSWSSSYNQGGLKRFLRILLWLHVLLPHGIMFILLLIFYFYS